MVIFLLTVVIIRHQCWLCFTPGMASLGRAQRSLSMRGMGCDVGMFFIVYIFARPWFCCASSSLFDLSKGLLSCWLLGQNINNIFWIWAGAHPRQNGQICLWNYLHRNKLCTKITAWILPESWVSVLVIDKISLVVKFMVLSYFGRGQVTLTTSFRKIV